MRRVYRPDVQAFLHLDELLQRPSSASELWDLTLPGVPVGHLGRDRFGKIVYGECAQEVIAIANV